MNPTDRRARIRRVTDLYVVGETVTLKDGSPLWLQAMNPAERQEAATDARAAAARTRITLLENPEGELAIARALFLEGGREAAIERMVEKDREKRYLEALDELRTDEEWAEKSAWLERADELATSATDAEAQQLAEVASGFATELRKRIAQGEEIAQLHYRSYDDEELWNEFREWYVDREANRRALMEYRYGELLYAARVCDAQQVSDTEWDHSECDHSVRVWESKADVLALPEDLTDFLFAQLAVLEFSDRDAKNSHRQGSSSASSPLPSEEAESTPSMSIEGSAALLGT